MAGVAQCVSQDLTAILDLFACIKAGSCITLTVKVCFLAAGFGRFFFLKLPNTIYSIGELEVRSMRMLLLELYLYCLLYAYKYFLTLFGLEVCATSDTTGFGNKMSKQNKNMASNIKYLGNCFIIILQGIK